MFEACLPHVSIEWIFLNCIPIYNIVCFLKSLRRMKCLTTKHTRPLGPETKRGATLWDAQGLTTLQRVTLLLSMINHQVSLHTAT